MSDLVELLEPHKTSLEELTIGDLADWDSSRDHPELLALRDFTSLRKLDSNRAAWAEIMLEPQAENGGFGGLWNERVDEEPLHEKSVKLCEQLPSSLTTLILRENDNRPIRSWEWDFRQLDHLVKTRHATLPNLKRVHYIIEEGFEEE